MKGSLRKNKKILNVLKYILYKQYVVINLKKHTIVEFNNICINLFSKGYIFRNGSRLGVSPKGRKLLTKCKMRY